MEQNYDFMLDNDEMWYVFGEGLRAIIYENMMLLSKVNN